MQNVVSIHDRNLPFDEGKTEKEIQELARLARKMRKQEARWRATVAALTAAGCWVGVKGISVETLPVDAMKIDLIKLTQ